ncbi:Pfs domain protein [Aspergillus campestris IBT 28561]|uniref:Pfs domain protein n=1 Tax=Aspergillus campestris (strain IBT 28561) TaxID=1392248 RepID=A0A2I1D1X2_ASPC2|nr:Pfs domain protein [Aspergillus campestris IBT 28561]PKY03848.1 Pfs domain protein [Aspergillus campestris IBT 28561]
MATGNHRSLNDYTVGWLCALSEEMAAAEAMLDETHESLPLPESDDNSYTFGKVGGHCIVIACLPAGEYGTTYATAAATHLISTFGRSIRFGLMVGIGGGIPSENADIRLGDVVVSHPRFAYGGVVQYDYGKALHDGIFQSTGQLNGPPNNLLSALSKLQATHHRDNRQFMSYLRTIGRGSSQFAARMSRPALEDRLYCADYKHVEGRATCSECDIAKIVSREIRDTNEPHIHYGVIASGNKVVKDSQLRDKLGHKFNAYCLDMESAGLMNHFKCLVIRGISDYSDSHKNDRWQGYAAAAAAAFAKEFLLTVPVVQTRNTEPMTTGPTSLTIV